MIKRVRKVEIENSNKKINSLYTIITPYQLIPAGKLKINRTYQRDIENKRLMALKESISLEGYRPNSLLILNQKADIVDGQHRAIAASESDLKIEVPVSVYNFDTIEKEAEFFSRINNYNCQLHYKDLWHSRNLYGYPTAKTIYKLENDENSLFFDKIAIRGKFSPRSKFSISEVIVIICGVACERLVHWSIGRDSFINQLIINNEYENIKKETNSFLDFFYKCFGQEKRSNPLPWRNNTIRAIVAFYDQLKNQGHLSKNDSYIRVITKMSNFQFDASFDRLTQYNKIIMLNSYFNKGRRTNFLKIDSE